MLTMQMTPTWTSPLHQENGSESSRAGGEVVDVKVVAKVRDVAAVMVRTW